VRTLAVRAFDTDGMMVGWELVEGRDLEAAIERLNKKSARGLSARPLCGAGLLRGAGGAELARRHSGARAKAREPGIQKHRGTSYLSGFRVRPFGPAPGMTNS